MGLAGLAIMKSSAVELYSIQGVYVNNGGLHWDRGYESLCSTYRVQGVEYCKCSVSVQSYANNVVVVYLRTCNCETTFTYRVFVLITEARLVSQL